MAWLLNILLPGAGLILRRREWLGLLFTLLFGICGNVAIAGAWIAPEAIPRGLAVAAAALGVLMWFVAQGVLYRQIRLLASHGHTLVALLDEIRGFLDSEKLEDARIGLESGEALDDESIELHRLRVRYCEMIGDDDGRESALRRIRKLSPHHEADALAG